MLTDCPMPATTVPPLNWVHCPLARLTVPHRPPLAEETASTGERVGVPIPQMSLPEFAIKVACPLMMLTL